MLHNARDQWTSMRIRLRQRRMDRGLTQRDVAKAMAAGWTLGDPSGLSRLEAGRHEPTIYTVMSWAEALDARLVLVDSELRRRLMELDDRDLMELISGARAASDGIKHPDRYRLRSVVNNLLRVSV